MLIGINVAKLREGKPSEYLTRFLFGGIVTVVATLISEHYGPIIGGLFLAFPGIFAAAPTIALASLSLTAHQHGNAYIALEARSMICGALAFFLYACVVSFILMRYRPRSLVAAGALSPIWFAVAFTLWALLLRK